MFSNQQTLNINNEINKRSIKNVILRIFLFSILGIFVLYFLLPLFIMVSTSLKSLDEIRAGSLVSLPREITFEAWKAAWTSTCTGIQCEGVKPFFINSILVAIPAVIISTFIGAINGYVDCSVEVLWLKFNIFVNVIWLLHSLSGNPITNGKTFRNNEYCGTIQGLVFVHVIYGIGFTTLFFKISM